MKTTAEQIKALKDERGVKITSMDALVEKMSTENRAFTADEQKQYDDAKKDIEGLNSRIKVLEEKQDRDRSTPAAYPGGGSEGGDADIDDEKKKEGMYRKFSWKRTINRVVSKKAFDGVEGELNTEERKLMEGNGVTDINPESMMVPAGVFRYMRNANKIMKRDMDATTGTAAPNNEGSFTIQQNVQGMVDVFLPEMSLAKVPVMRMNNLRGNLRFPQAQTLPSAGWNTENGTATEKSPKLAKLELSPKRLAAYIQLSNQLLIQSEENIQAYANRFLIQAAAIEFEKASLKGGGSNEPVGILGSASNYQRIFAGDAVNNAVNANGARLVWADWVKLVTTPKGLNSTDGQAYITSPAMKGRAQITPRQSAGVEGNFILRDYNSGINGFPVHGTTNLPDTFVKGASSALSAVIFGDWSNLLLASWGGMEVGVDPYTNMKEGMVNLVLGSYLDCGVLNPAAFAAVIDAQSY